MILRIDCPFATDGAGLYINTWNEQTEVSFHYGRAEYSDWDGTGADDHVREAMEVARDVLPSDSSRFLGIRGRGTRQRC